MFLLFLFSGVGLPPLFKIFYFEITIYSQAVATSLREVPCTLHPWVLFYVTTVCYQNGEAELVWCECCSVSCTTRVVSQETELAVVRVSLRVL